MQAAPPSSALEDLRQLLALQRSRAEAYNRFEEGFRRFLIQGNDQAGYQELVKQLTSEFASISTGIRAVEARLRPSRARLADLIVRLQSCEKEKLTITAKLHVQRRRIRELEMAEEFIEPELTYELRGFTTELQNLVSAINEIIDEFQAELQEEVGDEPEDMDGVATEAKKTTP